MFHFVRLPFDHWIAARMAGSPLLFWIRSAYAPLTEEPAKLWPLLLPAVRRHITAENVGRFALAFGLGFAIGEIVTVADLLLAHDPKLAQQPWWQWNGFIGERLMTCAIHPAMTSLALVGWRRWRSFPLGLALAMTAHWCSNFPIGMSHRGWLGPNPAVAQTIVALWLDACFVAAVIWLILLFAPRAGSFQARLFGQAICPECGQRYGRAWLGLNATGGRRYEPCPHCRKWHWTVKATPSPE
jgi:uncharacterized membrane protein YhfC